MTKRPALSRVRAVLVQRSDRGELLSNEEGKLERLHVVEARVAERFVTRREVVLIDLL